MVYPAKFNEYPPDSETSEGLLITIRRNLLKNLEGWKKNLQG